MLQPPRTRVGHEAHASHALRAEFLQHILPKLEWAALRDAAVRTQLPPCALAPALTSAAVVQAGLGLAGLPEEVSPEMLESDTFLRAFHHVLLEACLFVGSSWLPVEAYARARCQVHVEEGALICPESGHRFVIRRARVRHTPARCMRRRS